MHGSKGGQMIHDDATQLRVMGFILAFPTSLSLIFIPSGIVAELPSTRVDVNAFAMNA